MVWNCSIVAVTLLFGVSGKSKAFRNESKTIGEHVEKMIVQNTERNYWNIFLIS